MSTLPKGAVLIREFKRCGGPCGRRLRATKENFSADAENGDGLQRTCKLCRRERQRSYLAQKQAGGHKRPCETHAGGRQLGGRYAIVQGGPPLQRAVYETVTENGVTYTRRTLRVATTAD